MTVRAKFRVTLISSQKQNYYDRKPDGGYDYHNPRLEELRTIHLTAVYGHGDPNHENTKFWQATPSGEITLGTINPEAWAQFELDKEYYVDFTFAE